ncbi:hypothetical protein BV898_09239 [Hypsibius exemplaris]|uniref:Uncharacterized protein n=1 Tax=Hypsibius exemplaris TaxID=2072580 RepID=A0A1W0WMZ9_HYPEX|nr:hypothetical protein BV898_09239 [Hypsibius exemplaris]
MTSMEGSPLFYTFFVGFAVMATAAVDRSSFNITIVTYGSPHTPLAAGLPYTAPAYELAVREIRETWGYTVRHVLVQAEEIETCADLEDYAYLVSEFYYRGWDQQSLFVLTLPGECFSVHIETRKMVNYVGTG